MCVIIHKPAKIKLSENTLKSAWEHNSDGAGISFNTGNVVKVIKGLMTLDDFQKVYKELERLELVIHLRFATHGEVSKKFTHPFIIDSKFHAKEVFETDMAFHHNGILHGFGSANFSDSADYAKRILSKITDINAMKHVLSRETSKFALHTTNNVHLIGHYSGHEGCNFSNLNFIPVTKYPHAWSKTLLPYSSNSNSILQQDDVWELSTKLQKLFEEYSGEYYHYAEELNDINVSDTCCEFSEYLYLMYDIILSTSEAIELDEYMDSQYTWDDAEVEELNPFDV